MLIELKTGHMGFSAKQIFRAVERDILPDYFIIKKNGEERKIPKDKCKVIYPLQKIAAEYETAENILECLIESWNDSNPESRMNDELINLIKNHLRYAYVAGWDDLRMKLERFLHYSSTQISKYFLQAKIKEFCNGKDTI